MKLHEFQRLIREAHLWSGIDGRSDVVVRIKGIYATENRVKTVKVRHGVVIVEF